MAGPSGRGIVLRFGTQDAERIDQALQNMAAGAERTASRVASASNQQAAATASADRALAALQRRYDPLSAAERDLARLTEARSRAQGQSAAELEKLDRAITGVTGKIQAMRVAERATAGQGWDNAFRGVSEAARGIEDLRNKYVPLLALEAAHRKELVEIAALTSSGKLTYDQHVAAVERSNKAFQTQSATLDQNARATKANAYAQQQLTLQLNDVVGGLLGGQPPLQILIQQGPQVAQAVGGWSKAFQFLRDPLVLATAGFAAVTAGVVAFISRGAQLEAEARKIGGALAAMGGASGLNTADVQGVIRRQTALPGFDRDTTAQAAQQLLGVRQIQGAQFEQTLDVARNFALLTGQELPQALQTLSGALAGGADGLKRLDEQYNFLTLDQVKLIESLQRQGKVQEVTTVGLTALAARFKDGGSVLSDYQKATEEARKTTAEFFDSIANSAASKAALGFFGQLAKAQADFLKSLVPDADPIKALQEQLKAKQAALVLLQAGGLEGVAAGAFDQFFGKNFDFERLFKGGAGESSADAAKRKIAELAEEINKLQGARDAAAWMTQLDLIFKQQATNAQAAGKKVEELVKQYLPLREGAKQAADYMETLWQAIQKATDPARVAELSAALQGVARAANDAARGVVGTAEFERADAEDLARTSRNQRAVREAQQRALRTWLDMSPEAQAQTSLAAITAAEVGKVGARIREEAKNLFEDLSAGNRQLLGLVDAYGKGLAEAYREAARQAGIEAERTQAGVSADAVKVQKLIEQSLQGLQALRAGNIDFGRQTEAQERLAGAEPGGVAAVREATRANEVAQFKADALARAQANLADATESGDARRIASARKIIDSIDEEAKKRDDLLKRQQDAARTIEAIQFNRQHDSEEAYKAEIDKIRDLAEKGTLTARAVADATEEAEIRRGRASTSFTDGAIAGLLEYGRTARTVGQGVADSLVQGLQQAADIAARITLGMEVNLKSALQNLQLGVLRSLYGGVFGSLSSGIGGLFGGGPTLGTQTITVGGQPVTIQSGGGGGLFGGGLGIPGLGGGDLFGAGSFLSRPLWGGVNPLFGAGLAPFLGGGSLAGIGLGGAGAGAAGLGIGSGVGSLSGVLGGLFGIGTGIMGLAGGNPIGGISGLLGGGLGLAGGLGLLGSWAGPAGMAIGLLGGLLGSLLGKKPVAPQAVSNLSFLDGSWSSSLAMSRGKGSLGTGTGKAAGAIGDALDDLTAAYGLSFLPGAPGGYIGNSIGKKTGNTWFGGLGEYGGARGVGLGAEELIQGASSAQQVIDVVAAAVIKRAAQGGTLAGLTATQRTALSNADLASIDDVKKALDFSKLYDRTILARDAITEAGDAIENMKEQTRGLTAQAKDYGLATDILQQRLQESINQLATDTNTDYRRRLLGLTPEGALQVSLEQNEEAHQKALREAAEINRNVVGGALADINQIEQFYAAERVEIIRQANAAANDALKDIWKRLSYGDLAFASPLAALTGTQATADALYAQAQAGSLTARGQLPQAILDLFTAQTAWSGNDPRYEALRQLWLGRLDEFVADNNNVTGGGAANTVDGGAVAEMRQQLGALTQQVTSLTGALQDQAREISRLLARL